MGENDLFNRWTNIWFSPYIKFPWTSDSHVPREELISDPINWETPMVSDLGKKIELIINLFWDFTILLYSNSAKKNLFRIFCKDNRVSIWRTNNSSLFINKIKSQQTKKGVPESSEQNKITPYNVLKNGDNVACYLLFLITTI